MEQQDLLKRVFARLSALRQNLPKDTHVPIHWAEDYHAALQELENLGIDIKEFRIPSDQFKQIRVGGNYVTGEVRYSRDYYVQRDFFMAKLDAVLVYFELSHGDRQPKIVGFAAGTSGTVTQQETVS